MTNTSAVVARVQALLAKARDGGATEAEAAAAAAAAERLLARHSLSMQDVERDPISGRDTGLRYMDPWIRNMAKNAARLYGCEMILVDRATLTRSRKTGQVKRVTYTSADVYGRPESTAVAVSMISYLYDTVIRMSRDHSPLRRGQLGFRRGAGERLAHRLWEMTQAQTERPSQDTGDGTSVLVVERDEAREWMKQNLTIKRVRVGQSDTSSRSAAAGWAAAGSVHLGGQVGAGGASVRLESGR